MTKEYCKLCDNYLKKEWTQTKEYDLCILNQNKIEKDGTLHAVPIIDIQECTYELGRNKDREW